MKFEIKNEEKKGFKPVKIEFTLESVSDVEKFHDAYGDLCGGDYDFWNKIEELMRGYK